MRIIITGATGMVGEGILLECLKNNNVSEVLIIGRKHYNYQHPKLKELLVKDFFQLNEYAEQLKNYDACFYCAGVSSIGMNEKDYSYITYDTTMHVAKLLVLLNPNMVFNFVTGRYTDSSGTSKMMWARVKGKTENDLMKLGFRGQYNFRPGFMAPVEGQQNVKRIFKIFGLFYPKLFPKQSLTLTEVADAMINTVTKGYAKQVLEVEDIKALAKK
ncbi:MAG: NAD-dependent epimerase/dehydratase family protein [Sphingobacteriia bacterium]|nr:NAD-dependent epimerase/dehydratase family protein [Sphingobacteriia bacterium]